MHVHEIAENLRRRGWHVDIYAPEFRSGRPGLLLRLPVFLLLQLKLAAAFRPGDVIYVRAHMMAFFIAVFAWLRGAVIVHEVNGAYRDAFVAYPGLRSISVLLCWLQRWQYRRASHLIGVTEGLAAWLSVEAGHSRVSCVSNGANTALFNPGIPPASAIPDGRYVIFSGGLAKWHGLEVMAAAVRDEAWPPGVRLLILGGENGPADLIESMEGAADIVLAGPVAYESVAGYLRGAVAGLVPITDPGGRSRTGLAPLKLFECLACGVPAIVSDLPGQSALVSEAECGLVVPPEDPGALARAVRWLADHPEAAQAMGRRGASLIVNNYSWAHAAAQTASILRALVDGKQARSADSVTPHAAE